MKMKEDTVYHAQVRMPIVYSVPLLKNSLQESHNLYVLYVLLVTQQF